MAHPLRLTFDLARSPLIETTIEIVTRRISERGGAPPVIDGAAVDVVFDLQPALGAEAFAIVRDEQAGVWRISGGDEHGVLYGAGKFLRGCRFDTPEVVYAGPSGTFAPAQQVRGMYFATHFHNFYHDAPLELVEHYVEDLALWGCNTLSVWFDMHHYTGIDDPAAQEMLTRLRAILRAANRAGMGAALTSLANEAYSTSPPELRAVPFPHHYHVEICPSKPDGLALILRWRAEMLQEFADLDIRYFWIWPYDQGGCGCAECKPWGGNGFLHNAEPVARQVRQVWPLAKTVLSTWEFGYWEGDPEWEAFYAAMAPPPDWVDYLMAEGHGDYPPYILQHGPPPGFPLLNFPEISMSGMWPWGGYGANLQPRRLQKVWDSIKDRLAGGFPYSEGIFEDLNKVICLQLYWNPERAVADIVREYAAEMAPEAADDVTAAIYLLEEQMQHGLASEENREAWRRKYISGEDDGQIPLYQLPRGVAPEKAFGLLDAAARTMTPAAAASWRWRFLWLRAALDLELTRSHGCPTTFSDSCFAELSRISYAENAEECVQIPSRRSLAQPRKRFMPLDVVTASATEV